MQKKLRIKSVLHNGKEGIFLVLTVSSQQASDRIHASLFVDIVDIAALFNQVPDKGCVDILLVKHSEKCIVAIFVSELQVKARHFDDSLSGVYVKLIALPVLQVHWEQVVVAVNHAGWVYGGTPRLEVLLVVITVAYDL